MIKHKEPLDFLSSLDMLLTLHIPYDRDLSVHAAFLLNFEPMEPLPCLDNHTLLPKRGFLAQMSDGSLAVQVTLKGYFLLLQKYPVIIKVNLWHVSTKKGSPLPAWVLECANSNNRNSGMATIPILPFVKEYKLWNILSLVGYTIISEEKATICIDGMNPTQILTIVAYSISVMCLSATLVKYCRTARLKTLPGKLMINLLLPLIVAHGSMLITSCFHFLDTSGPVLLWLLYSIMGGWVHSPGWALCPLTYVSVSMWFLNPPQAALPHSHPTRNSRNQYNALPMAPGCDLLAWMYNSDNSMVYQNPHLLFIKP